jgi:hypothetical protein
MFNTLFKILGLAPASPVADWPEIDATTPPIDLANRAIGPLIFGALFEEARTLGRPDRFARHNQQTCSLIYARLGLHLEFDARAGLEYAAYFIAPDRHDPDHPLLRHCTPCLTTGRTLTAQTTEADLCALFGPPQTAERDADETVLFHELHGLTVECELTPAGTLKRVNLLPT